MSLFDANALDLRSRVKVSEVFSAAVAFSPDGKQIAVGGADNVVRLIDASDGRELFAARGHTDAVSAVAFDPEGRFVASAGVDGTVRMWDPSSGKISHEFPARPGIIFCLAVHPTLPLVASGSNDETIRLWDARTGDEVRAFRGHAGTIWAVKFSPDGRRLFSGSSDGTVKVWDVSSGLELCTLAGHSHWVRDIDVSPDGWSIVSSGKDQEIHIWNAGSLGPAEKDAREAAGLVDFLALRAKTREGTLAAIELDATISETVRRQAQKLAQSYPFHLAYIEEGHRAADEADWPRAVVAFQQALNMAPREVWHWHWLAMAQLGAQDSAGYARTRKEMLQRFGLNRTDTEAYVLARTCLIVPPPSSMWDSLKPILSEHHRWFPKELWPAVLFGVRRGNTSSIALQELERSGNPRFNAVAAYVLALAYFCDARLADAQSTVAMGDRRRLEGKFDWEHELYRDIIRDEVLELLESADAASASPTPTPD